MALYEKSEPSTPDPGPSTSGIQHAAQAEAEEKAVCQHGAKATDKTPGQDKKVRKTIRKPKRSKQPSRRSRKLMKRTTNTLRKSIRDRGRPSVKKQYQLNEEPSRNDPKQDRGILGSSQASSSGIAHP